MVKFLHTADWHLGIKYAQLGDKADVGREIRIKTVQKLLKTARESNVDFIIIAGDLFDTNIVERSLLERVIQLMVESSPLDIYILPGNHDPLTMDSPLLDPAWESVSNVHVFQNAEPLIEENSGAILYPCPITQKQSNDDFTEWIEADKSEISIGIAHGNLSIEGRVKEPNFPIDPERTQKANLDYLALGEWHSFSSYKDKDGIYRTVYPGTPETTKFGLHNSGKAVIVDINGKNQPIINEIQTGCLKWVEMDETVYSTEDLQNLERNINNIHNRRKNVLKIALNGVVEQELWNNLESLSVNYNPEFMFLKVSMDNIYLKPNPMEFKAMIPEGNILGQTFDSLLALMKYHPLLQEYSSLSPEEADKIVNNLKEHESVTHVSPEVLQSAILILYQMAREAAI